MADTAYDFPCMSVSALFMMELLSTSSGIRHATLVANALMCVRFVISAQRFSISMHQSYLPMRIVRAADVHRPHCRSASARLLMRFGK